MEYLLAERFFAHNCYDTRWNYNYLPLFIQIKVDKGKLVENKQMFSMIMRFDTIMV